MATGTADPTATPCIDEPLPGPRAFLFFGDYTPKKGTKIEAHMGVRKCAGHGGTTMNLKKKSGGVFTQFKSVQLNGACRATIEVGTDYNEEIYRAFWPKQDADHRQGRSGIHLVETHP